MQPEGDWPFAPPERPAICLPMCNTYLRLAVFPLLRIAKPPIPVALGYLCGFDTAVNHCTIVRAQAAG